MDLPRSNNLVVRVLSQGDLMTQHRIFPDLLAYTPSMRIAVIFLYSELETFGNHHEASLPTI